MHFEVNLPVPPDRAWPYLTHPDRMNEWSEARIELIAPGPGGLPDAAGATRRVTVSVLGFSAHLAELVEEAVPPSHFVYRVTAGGCLRRHKGEIRLTPSGGGTTLVWEVTFSTYVPGLGLLMKWLIGRSLGRSLAVLERLLSQQASPGAAS